MYRQQKFLVKQSKQKTKKFYIIRHVEQLHLNNKTVKHD